MLKKRIITNLIIANLILIFLYMLGKFQIFHEFIKVIIWVIFTPIIFGVFLFYILRPLNNIFFKKGLKNSISSTITVLIAMALLFAIANYFGRYLLEQINILKDIVLTNVKDKNIIGMTQKYLKDNSIKSFIENISSQLMIYVNFVLSNIKQIFDIGMMIFSNILLVILITFFLLRDGSQFKPIILKYIPKKYKEISSEILSEGDVVLSSYIIGQATVAISLATMVFIGYKVIGMPSSLILASTTFILAFIPFVGFFISMIIPYIIAAALGTHMIVRLTLLFVIAQTLKGRVVVPFIMGKAMKMHPITDIFLVVGASTIGGPLAAFCVVPIYSLLKLTYKKLVEKDFLADPSDTDK